MAGSVLLAEFKEYIGTTEDSDFIEESLDAGHALVDNYQGEATVPADLHRIAILLCASEIFHRRSAPNGIAQFASMDGSPVRVAKDPMGAVYPLLLPYVGYAV
jgi:hypothetical protein